MPVHISILTSFWKKVDKDGPLHPICGQCWIWTAFKNKDGYGVFRGIGAHRVSWKIHNGRIPDGLMVLHKCDNPGCIRPDHLFTGTDSDNIADSLAKGRYPEGETSYAAKLTKKQVNDIRSRYRRGLGASLAREFGVTRMAISLIVRYKRYSR